MRLNKRNDYHRLFHLTSQIDQYLMKISMLLLLSFICRFDERRLTIMNIYIMDPMSLVTFFSFRMVVKVHYIHLAVNLIAFYLFKLNFDMIK
jgi:hypothetical protein